MVRVLSPRKSALNNINFIDKIKKMAVIRVNPTQFYDFCGLDSINQDNWGLYLAMLLGIWMKFVCHNLDLGHDLGIFDQQTLELLIDEISQVTKIFYNFLRFFFLKKI